MQATDYKLNQFEKNLFIQKYHSLCLKEQLFADTIDSTGFLRKQITKCAYPNFVGRKIITTASTNEAVERFPLDSKAIAYSYAEGSTTRLSGRKNQSITIKMDKYAEYAEQWTTEFIEDASQKTYDNIVNKAGTALGENETKTVIDLYESIEEQDLAGGDYLDQNNEIMDWTAVLKLHNAVRCENFRPNVLLLNETQLGQLLLDNRFIEYEYLSNSDVDLESTGLIRSIVGMKVESKLALLFLTAQPMQSTHATQV
jgi:hypothetical protein